MITIKRSGNLLEISDSALINILDEPLSYFHRTTFYGLELLERNRYKYAHPEDTKFNPKFEVSKRAMYQIKEGRIYCAAGLKSKVFKTLQSYSIEYEYKDLRSNLLPPANFDKLSEIPNLHFKYKQDEILAVIDSCDGGIIVAPTGLGKTHVTAMLLKVYSKSRILVVSPGLDLIKSTYTRLLTFCPDVGRVGGGKYEPDPRVTLCSADSLHKLNLNNYQLIIYDEVHTAGTQSRLADLSQYTNAKFIGFSASFPARGDGADDLVEAIFGPVLLRINYDKAAEQKAVTPIKVLFINVPPEDGVSYGSQSPVTWARHVYWRNDYRNKKIAKAANLIPKWLNQTDPQILIMVDKLEHAYELRKYLPDYELVYATKSTEMHNRLVSRKLAEQDEETLDAKSRDQKRKDFESGKIRKAISTGVWKAGVDFVGLQALIRADGGVSEVNSIQIPGRLSRTKDGKEFALLIDLMDKLDPRAHRRSTDRKKQYLETGWECSTIHDMDAPLDLTQPQPASKRNKKCIQTKLEKS